MPLGALQLRESQIEPNFIDERLGRIDDGIKIEDVQKITAMLTSSLRTAILPLSLAASFGAFAARGVLKADGIIRVKGAELHSTMVTVVPGNGASYGLPIGAKYITLDLPLDDVYLVSVQREGCPTKEVYFDTRVPVEMHAAEFRFPFQVTLESLPPERMFAYEGPVGFVRYVHALKDFGYETDYSVRVDEDLKLRMKEFQQSGIDPKTFADPILAQVIDRPRGGYSAPLGDGASERSVASVVSEVPPLVHVVSAPTTTFEEPAGRGSELLASVAPVITHVPLANLPPRSPVDVLASMPAVQAAKWPEAAPVQNTNVALPTEDLRVAPNTLPVLIGTTSRTEELITEQRRVTRIIRITEPTGNMEEYRKVTHAFGAVYYFQDSRSITERDFAQAIDD